MAGAMVMLQIGAGRRLLTLLSGSWWWLGFCRWQNGGSGGYSGFLASGGGWGAAGGRGGAFTSVVKL